MRRARWAGSDYKRLWIEPGLSFPLAPFQEAGAVGAVFILDCSYEALAGSYLPFTHGFEPLPALFVDRDTGRELRAQAASRPSANLTLTASRSKSPTQAITAVLPGESPETIIFNTHTDGQGFVEENAGVAFVQLARYFPSLRSSERLKRTLVFAAWPGHMVADLPRLRDGSKLTPISSRGQQRRSPLSISAAPSGSTRSRTAATRLDSVPAAELREGDPTLGK